MRQLPLRFAYASNSQPVIDAMNEFGRLVKEKQTVPLQIQYFPDGQLGGEQGTNRVDTVRSSRFHKSKCPPALESFSKRLFDFFRSLIYSMMKNISLR